MFIYCYLITVSSNCTFGRVGDLDSVNGFLVGKVEPFLLPFLAVNGLVLHLGRG
jgi:hypothetical protein